MAKVLVTGGLGFLGQHLIDRLTRDGHDVRIFARPGKNNGANAGNAEIVWGDIRDPDAVKTAVSGLDFVFHLVSNFRKGGSDKNEAHAINVDGTANVLNACQEAGVKQLVHCSTIGVHGSVLEVPATENTAFNPMDLYQETKLIAEKKVWEFHQQTGLPVTVVRPISLYGPGDLRMLKLFKMIKTGKFFMVGDGSPYFQPAYIDDVVNGFMLCLDNPKAIGEAFIIGNEEYLHLRDLVKLIAEELKVPYPTKKMPLKPLLLAATLCEKICAPFGIEPPLHRRRVSFFQNNRAFSVAKAKELLGFKSEVTLRDGVQRTIRWYEENGYL